MWYDKYVRAPLVGVRPGFPVGKKTDGDETSN